MPYLGQGVHEQVRQVWRLRGVLPAPTAVGAAPRDHAAKDTLLGQPKRPASAEAIQTHSGQTHRHEMFPTSAAEWVRQDSGVGARMWYTMSGIGM